MNSSLLNKWASKENLKTNKIASFKINEGETYFIDGLTFFEMISELNQLIQYQPEKLSEMASSDRRKANLRMDILYGAALNLLNSSEKIDDYIKINSEKIQILKKILEDYNNFKNKIITNENLAAAPKQVKREKNIFKIIINAFIGFFASLFKFYAKGELPEDYEGIDEIKTLKKKDISHETTKIYRKTINLKSPIIPLSDFIEIIPENDYLVNRIIKDMRENNLKIVIPIYNARKNLYPKRSQKLLISDIEYLLIAPEKAKVPESIREFTDSLVGQKLKDETIPSSAIVAIEKYLLTLYRQRKIIR